MKASETKLQPIIEGTKQYVVPLFQRSYSWDRKEWQILWDDLIELCEMENPRTHFIGSMVTMPTTSVPEGVAKYLLIDGQQRLTTIFILLALIRDKARDNNQQELAEEINNTLLVNPYKRDTDYYKLLPTQGDRKSFQDLLRTQLPSDQNQILNAYLFFERKLRQTNLDGQNLKKVITNHLSVVSIVLDVDDNPHLVFESLNAKGRPLTQSDLIRNYFFMRIHVDKQDEIYSRYWKPMQDALGDTLTEFIRHYLMRDGKLVKQSEIYFSLKEEIAKQPNDKAEDELKNLAIFATYYQKLIFPKYETNSKIRKALARLDRIEVTTAYPFLLKCYHTYTQEEIDDDDLVDILKIIENYMIRRFVCGIPTNQLNKIFPPLYSQIQGKNRTSLIEGLKKVLQTKGYPKDVEFKSRLMDARLYGIENRSIKTKLILESIEEHFNHKELVSFS